jgi:hypothetical protein
MCFFGGCQSDSIVVYNPRSSYTRCASRIDWHRRIPIEKKRDIWVGCLPSRVIYQPSARVCLFFFFPILQQLWLFSSCLQTSIDNRYRTAWKYIGDFLYLILLYLLDSNVVWFRLYIGPCYLSTVRVI